MANAENFLQCVTTNQNSDYSKNSSLLLGATLEITHSTHLNSIFFVKIYFPEIVYRTRNISKRGLDNDSHTLFFSPCR